MHVLLICLFGDQVTYVPRTTYMAVYEELMLLCEKPFTSQRSNASLCFNCLNRFSVQLFTFLKHLGESVGPITLQKYADQSLKPVKDLF